MTDSESTPSSISSETMSLKWGERIRGSGKKREALREGGEIVMKGQQLRMIIRQTERRLMKVKFKSARQVRQVEDNLMI